MQTKIDQAVDSLLQHWDHQLPVDVYHIAAREGITIREEEMEDEVSGVLVLKDSSTIIVVNQSHHLHRKRFTIAHELGHYCLHRNENRVFIDAAPVYYRDASSSDGTKRQEVEANAVAAQLLMPDESLRLLTGNKLLDPFDDVAVHRLAKQFAVSVQAMTIRLTRLDLL